MEQPGEGQVLKERDRTGRRSWNNLEKECIKREGQNRMEVMEQPGEGLY